MIDALSSLPAWLGLLTSSGVSLRRFRHQRVFWSGVPLLEHHVLDEHSPVLGVRTSGRSSRMRAIRPLSNDAHGAALARLETRIAMEAALKHFPEWTVDGDNAVMTAGIDTRGWDSLPVEV